MAFTPDEIEQIKAIVQQVNADNYSAGDPDTPPHEHNGVDGFALSQTALKEFQTLPSFNTTGSMVQKAILALQGLEGPGGKAQGNILPTIFYGAGQASSSGQFQGGSAQPGTVLFFQNNPPVTGNFILTAAITAGNTGGILTAQFPGPSDLWPYATMTATVQLGGTGGLSVLATFTNGSHSVSWLPTAPANTQGQIAVVNTFQMWVSFFDGWHGIDFSTLKSF